MPTTLHDTMNIPEPDRTQIDIKFSSLSSEDNRILNIVMTGISLSSTGKTPDSVSIDFLELEGELIQKILQKIPDTILNKELTLDKFDTKLNLLSTCTARVHLLEINVVYDAAGIQTKHGCGFTKVVGRFNCINGDTLRFKPVESNKLVTE